MRLFLHICSLCPSSALFRVHAGDSVYSWWPREQTRLLKLVCVECVRLGISPCGLPLLSEDSCIGSGALISAAATCVLRPERRPLVTLQCVLTYFMPGMSQVGSSCHHAFWQNCMR